MIDGTQARRCGITTCVSILGPSMQSFKPQISKVYSLQGTCHATVHCKAAVQQLYSICAAHVEHTYISLSVKLLHWYAKP